MMMMEEKMLVKERKLWKRKCDGWKINYGSREPLLAFFVFALAMVIHYNGTEINSDGSSRKAFYVKRMEGKCF